MAESFYEDHDTNPIQLPHSEGPLRPRETFRAKTASESIFAAPLRADLNIFAPLDSRDPEGVKNYEVLRVGDVLHIPEIAYDEEGRQLPNTFAMNRYDVVGTSTYGEKLMADIENDGGIIETISADLLSDGAKLEAAIAKQLIDLDGIDIHNPDVQLIEPSDDRGRKV